MFLHFRIRTGPFELRFTALQLVFGGLFCAPLAHARDPSPLDEAKSSEEAKPREGDGAEGHSSVVMPTPIEASVTLPANSNTVPRVVLLLHLSAVGSVLDAKVTQGEEPYATLALDAAQAFRFTPATKNGVPSPCRFLYEVAWHRQNQQSQPRTRLRRTKPNALPHRNRRRCRPQVASNDVVRATRRPRKTVSK
ncbi:MAG: hypothetical protein QM784_05665 [Polyangiaceae bacterium]